MGINTAVENNPNVAKVYDVEASLPKKRGNTRFPDPKNIENKAKPAVKQIFLDIFIVTPVTLSWMRYKTMLPFYQAFFL